MGVCKVTAVLYERKRALSAEKAGNKSRKPAAPTNHRDGLQPTGPGPVNDSGSLIKIQALKQVMPVRIRPAVTLQIPVMLPENKEQRKRSPT